ncbi:MAG: hemerythrin domain-containing protein [Azonexus sp.]|jgi:hypothetical protein|nr:hemerythrin domain-containing protein [Azonexus sp.]
MSFFKELFRLIFGKHEEAAAPPPVVAPERMVAPGTNIHYHPELIDKLTGDHQVLLELFGETSEAAGRGDVVEAAERLDAFRVALHDHLLTENVKLYIYLTHFFAEDQQSHRLIHDFRHEMDAIGKVVLQFLGKYQDLAEHPELAPAFAKELAAIGKVLVDRIKREEGTLYPLYTG